MPQLATIAQEHVSLADGVTQAEIVCTTVNLVYCWEWRKQEHILLDVRCMRQTCRAEDLCTSGCKPAYCNCNCHDVILNVPKRRIPYLNLKNSMPFEDDSMQIEKTKKKTAQIIMNYSTHMAILMETGKKQMVVHCKNGRSRSPAVIAMFYIMFRGFPVEYAIYSLGEEFRAQRSDIASKSADFPNFFKFKICLNYAAEQRAKLVSGRDRSWEDRVRETCKLYNDWPERADRNLKKVDVDIIMEWLKCPVKDLKAPTGVPEGRRPQRPAAVKSSQRSAEMLKKRRKRTTSAAAAVAAAAAAVPGPVAVQAAAAAVAPAPSHATIDGDSPTRGQKLNRQRYVSSTRSSGKASEGRSGESSASSYSSSPSSSSFLLVGDDGDEEEEEDEEDDGDEDYYEEDDTEKEEPQRFKEAPLGSIGQRRFKEALDSIRLADISTMRSRWAVGLSAREWLTTRNGGNGDGVNGTSTSHSGTSNSPAPSLAPPAVSAACPPASVPVPVPADPILSPVQSHPPSPFPSSSHPPAPDPAPAPPASYTSTSATTIASTPTSTSVPISSFSSDFPSVVITSAVPSSFRSSSGRGGIGSCGKGSGRGGSCDMGKGAGVGVGGREGIGAGSAGPGVVAGADTTPDVDAAAEKKRQFKEAHQKDVAAAHAKLGEVQRQMEVIQASLQALGEKQKQHGVKELQQQLERERGRDSARSRDLDRELTKIKEIADILEATRSRQAAQAQAQQSQAPSTPPGLRQLVRQELSREREETREWLKEEVKAMVRVVREEVGAEGQRLREEGQASAREAARDVAYEAVSEVVSAVVKSKLEKLVGPWKETVDGRLQKVERERMVKVEEQQRGSEGRGGRISLSSYIKLGRNGFEGADASTCAEGEVAEVGATNENISTHRLDHKSLGEREGIQGAVRDLILAVEGQDRASAALRQELEKTKAEFDEYVEGRLKEYLELKVPRVVAAVLTTVVHEQARGGGGQGPGAVQGPVRSDSNPEMVVTRVTGASVVPAAAAADATTNGVDPAEHGPVPLVLPLTVSPGAEDTKDEGEDGAGGSVSSLPPSSTSSMDSKDVNVDDKMLHAVKDGGNISVWGGGGSDPLSAAEPAHELNQEQKNGNHALPRQHVNFLSLLSDEYRQMPAMRRMAWRDLRYMLCLDKRFHEVESNTEREKLFTEFMLSKRDKNVEQKESGLTPVPSQSSASTSRGRRAGLEAGGAWAGAGKRRRNERVVGCGDGQQGNKLQGIIPASQGFREMDEERAPKRRRRYQQPPGIEDARGGTIKVVKKTKGGGGVEGLPGPKWSCPAFFDVRSRGGCYNTEGGGCKYGYSHVDDSLPLPPCKWYPHPCPWGVENCWFSHEDDTEGEGGGWREEWDSRYWQH